MPCSAGKTLQEAKKCHECGYQDQSRVYVWALWETALGGKTLQFGLWVGFCNYSIEFAVKFAFNFQSSFFHQISFANCFFFCQISLFNGFFCQVPYFNFFYLFAPLRRLKAAYRLNPALIRTLRAKVRNLI